MELLVLKILKKGSLAVFFGEQVGKFIAHYQTAKKYITIFQGALIDGEYALTNGSKYPFVKSVEIIYSVQPQGIRTQFFLTFYFDTLYLFLPQQQPSTENFHFIKACVESDLFLLCEDHEAFGPYFSLVLMKTLGFFLPVSLDVFSQRLEFFLKEMALGSESGHLALHQELLLQYASIGGEIFRWILSIFKDHPQSKKMEKMLLLMRSEGLWG